MSFFTALFVVVTLFALFVSWVGLALFFPLPVVDEDEE